MNIFKLIRGFCKVTNHPYRQMKRDYNSMTPEKKRKTKRKLLNFWNDHRDVLNHQKYYDLKKPLVNS